ncbi:MAG: CDGSH iron-sulfur domain-containing protein [Armatimonadetes bacterium]|nr:CDGSH iron-sulfur domain-containing protein [Armatimonadota bacterium]
MSDATEITCNNNGPLRITGEDIILKDQSGKTFGLGGRKVIALCRCGCSGNKPFCDGSHKTGNFQSVVEARDLPVPGSKM